MLTIDICTATQYITVSHVSANVSFTTFTSESVENHSKSPANYSINQLTKAMQKTSSQWVHKLYAWGVLMVRFWVGDGKSVSG